MGLYQCIICGKVLPTSLRPLHFTKKTKRAVKNTLFNRCFYKYIFYSSSEKFYEIEAKRIFRILSKDDSKVFNNTITSVGGRSVNYYLSKYNEIVSAYYFELVENTFFRFLNELLQELSTDINEEREKYLWSLIKRLQAYYSKRITKSVFISDKCQRHYITWENIHFGKDIIKVSPNVAFLRSIPIAGSLEVLNNVKQSYFNRHFYNDKFKLISYMGVVSIELSPDVDKIKDRIWDHLYRNKIPTLNKSSLSRFGNGDLSKIEANRLLRNLSKKNTYIECCSKLIRKSDKVVAFSECNNGKNEEGLMMIFKGQNQSIILWENINPNRAAYAFRFSNDGLLENLQLLIKWASSMDWNKRYNLFVGNNVLNDRGVILESYYFIAHKKIKDYHANLNYLINDVT